MTPRHRSLARRARGGQGTGCMVLFFAVFLLAGIGLAIPLVYIPFRGVLEARGWEAVPCVIERAWVETHSGGDSDTYSVEVRYHYDVAGKRHHGDRYRFTVGSSSGQKGKQAVVAALPAGSTTTCWVDPADPRRSVLDRGLGWEALLALLPLVFVLVGGAGMAWAIGGVLRRRGGSAGGGLASLFVERVPAAGASGATAVAPPEVVVRESLPDPSAWPGWLPRPAGDGGAYAGPVRCAPNAGPLGKLIGIGCVALFWNGIVGVFVWQAVKTYREGALDGCLALFLVPFVLVGLALLVGVPYQFLALFNPRPEVILGRASVPVGGTLSFSWSFRGSAGRIARLRISAVGEEVAIYRRGTDTHTDRHTFADLQLVEIAAPLPLATGNGSLTIPAGSMHSLVASRNRIEWKLKLHAEIARWPDVDEEYELLVLPTAMAEGRSG